MACRDPFGANLVSLRLPEGTSEHMSDARTVEEERLEADDEDERQDEQYSGPDPEEDEKGDGADEDQGT